MVNLKPKPCVYCGKEVKTLRVPEGYSVYCISLKCKNMSTFDTENLAIENWNKPLLGLGEWMKPGAVIEYDAEKMDARVWEALPSVPKWWLFLSMFRF